MVERADLPAEKKRWAFVVYLAGDNNLSDEMVWSLQQMKAASDESSVQDSLDLVALFDPQGGEPRRYDFSSSGHPADAARDLRSLSIQSLLPPAEAPAQILEQLMTGIVRRDRILVLSGHGSGAVGDFLNDENPPSSLSIPALGRILEGASLEILGLDSCQMSSVEVGYEVRSSVRYLVASEGPVQNAGWPYRQVLEKIAENAASASDGIARAIADSYLLFYRDYEIAGISTDIAVSDLSRIGRVAQAVGELVRAMEAPLSALVAGGLEEAFELGELKRGASEASDESRMVRDAIVLAHWSAQSYKCDRYTDLHDFVRQLLRFSADRGGPRIGEIRKAGLQVLEAVEAAVVSSGATGAELQHSHGLSIYFPWSFRDFFPEYWNLRFAKDTGWAKFLQTYLRATQRMRRFQPAHLKAGVPAAPRKMRETEPGSVETRDVEAGTRKDELGKTCRSTMKNPPEGYYPPPGQE